MLIQDGWHLNWLLGYTCYSYRFFGTIYTCAYSVAGKRIYSVYSEVDEGELLFYRELVLSDVGVKPSAEKILFMQDNANNLKPIYSGYDVVVLPTLLEELICPIIFLKKIHERLNEAVCWL